MHANKREEIKEVYAGDIAAAVGLRDTTTGDTLCDEDKPIVLESIEFPEPVISIAIEPKTKADQEKLGGVAAEARDRGSVVPRRRPTRRPARRSSPAWASCTSRSSSTACCASSRSTPTSASRRSRTGRRSARRSSTKTRFVRQTGGRGQYGHVVLRVEPLPPGGGFEFVDGTKGGVDPARVHSGGREGRQGGDGDRRARRLPDGRREGRRCIDGSYHEVDSSEMAFKIAGSMAFKEALREGVAGASSSRSWRSRWSTPEEFMGDVIGDLNAPPRPHRRAWSRAAARR